MNPTEIKTVPIRVSGSVVDFIRKVQKDFREETGAFKPQHVIIDDVFKELKELKEKAA